VRGALLPLVWTAGATLAVAGIAKWRAPEPTAALLAALGSPAGPFAVRALAALELAAGASLVAAPGPLTGSACAALYVAFALVVLVARRRGVASCGCLGAAATEPSRFHAGLDAAFAAACAGAALVSPDGLPALAARDLGVAAVTAVAAVAATALVTVAFVYLVPALTAYARTAS
jgi:hypothetical protein